MNNRCPHRAIEPWIVLVFLLASESCCLKAFPQSAAGNKSPASDPAHTKQTGIFFVPADKRFSIWMPRTPNLEKNPLTTAFGPLIYFLYVATDQKAGYHVGYVDYPPDKRAQMSPAKLLRMAREVLQKKYGKGVIEDKAISYHGFPGRGLTFNVEVPAKVQVNIRYFLVKNRMHTLSVEHLQSTSMMKEAFQYMDTLTLRK